ncbi:IS630 family transposase [Verrucomicrobia bacterium LW23]|nr:IS630 family transposase [Verrucomicrobia bacterium LW23]
MSWARDSASAFFGSWTFATDCPALRWPKPTRNGSRRIKKLDLLAADPGVDLGSLDEVHFQQHRSRCRMWIAPEDKDPVVLHHPTRKSIGYFAAMRLRDGHLLTRREDKSFNGSTFWKFLKELEAASRDAGRRVVVISDNARYHHATLHKDWRIEQQPHFALDFLPPYSPQLNPIERVWKLLRRMRLHNQHFATLDAVLAAVEPQLDAWAKPNETLRKLCAFFG